MDKNDIRLACVQMALQVATAEALEKSQKAPSMERLAGLSKQFYDLVTEEVAKAPEESGNVSASSSPTPPRNDKKSQTDKDSIFT